MIMPYKKQDICFIQSFDVSKIINEKGCVQAGEEWVERNLLVIVTTAITVSFCQACIYLNYTFTSLYVFNTFLFVYTYAISSLSLFIYSRLTGLFILPFALLLAVMSIMILYYNLKDFFIFVTSNLTNNNLF